MSKKLNILNTEYKNLKEFKVGFETLFVFYIKHKNNSINFFKTVFYIRTSLPGIKSGLYKPILSVDFFNIENEKIYDLFVIELREWLLRYNLEMKDLICFGIKCISDYDLIINIKNYNYMNEEFKIFKTDYEMIRESLYDEILINMSREFILYDSSNRSKLKNLVHFINYKFNKLNNKN